MKVLDANVASTNLPKHLVNYRLTLVHLSLRVLSSDC